MNKITVLLTIVCLVSLSGCRSTKKAIKTHVDTSINTDIKQEVKIDEVAKVNNDINTETTTETTETNYFNPDSVKTTTTISDGNGIVKSTKTTKTTTKKADKTKTETNKEVHAKKEENTKEKDNTKIEQTDKKTVPIQWWPIFGIVCIILIIVIYFKRKTIFTQLFKI